MAILAPLVPAIGAVGRLLDSSALDKKTINSSRLSPYTTYAADVPPFPTHRQRKQRSTCMMPGGAVMTREHSNHNHQNQIWCVNKEKGIHSFWVHRGLWPPVRLWTIPLQLGLDPLCSLFSPIRYSFFFPILLIFHLQKLILITNWVVIQFFLRNNNV